MHRIRIAVVACALGLLAVSAAQAAIDSNIRKSFNVAEGGTLIIDTDIADGRSALTLSTSGGDVKVGDAAANVSAKTSGGDIEIKRVAGNLAAHTSGGSITIDEAHGAIDASTSGGSIEARIAQRPSGDSTLKTSGGGITLSIAPNVAIDVDAHTSGGDIETDVPVTLLGKQSESTLEGKLNGGGPRVVLRTSGGDIRLRKM